MAMTVQIWDCSRPQRKNNNDNMDSLFTVWLMGPFSPCLWFRKTGFSWRLPVTQLWIWSTLRYIPMGCCSSLDPENQLIGSMGLKTTCHQLLTISVHLIPEYEPWNQCRICSFFLSGRGIRISSRDEPFLSLPAASHQSPNSKMHPRSRSLFCNEYMGHLVWPFTTMPISLGAWNQGARIPANRS